MKDDLRYAHMNDGDFDYGESTDIAKLHAAVMREKEDPRGGSEAVPLWYITVIGVLLFIGGIYFAMFSGGFSPDAFSIYAGGSFLKKPGKSATGPAEKPKLSLAEIGKKVYSNCASCHGPGGTGSPGLYPPLAGSEWVNGNGERLAAIVLHGVGGPLKVGGAQFNGAMPPWKALKDEQIAGVITYIRSQWGNNAPEITPEQIAYAREKYKSRKEPWTEAELNAITDELPAPQAQAPAAEASPAAATPANP